MLPELHSILNLLEGGFSADNGTQADAANNRFFDRQTWVGLASPNAGEIRFGRQNGPIQSHGAYIDYTARGFSVPGRVVAGLYAELL